MVGGYTNSWLGCTEEFNGLTWSTGGALGNARYQGATVGSQNAALAAGGGPSTPVGTCAEKYNGSTWAGSGALINNLRGRGL